MKFKVDTGEDVTIIVYSTYQRVRAILGLGVLDKADEKLFSPAGQVVRSCMTERTC